MTCLVSTLDHLSYPAVWLSDNTHLHGATVCVCVVWLLWFLVVCVCSVVVVDSDRSTSDRSVNPAVWLPDGAAVPRSHGRRGKFHGDQRVHAGHQVAHSDCTTTARLYSTVTQAAVPYHSSPLHRHSHSIDSMPVNVQSIRPRPFYQLKMTLLHCKF